ncbi:MAG: class I SAM-dependent methyltransferase [Planctomycetota bacterium]
MSEAAREISAAHVVGLSQQDMAGYWWYAVRQGWVRRALRRQAARGPLRYLDFGCGTGGVLASVRREFAPEEALGLDGTQDAIDVGLGRGLPVRLADFRRPIEPGFAPNAITCLDVLEHLEDPVRALRHLRAVADPQALLVVTVPAMPSLWSRWDEICGHHRRYTRALLREHLRQGGFEPTRVRYAFSYCWPPAWWQRRVRKQVQEFEFPPVSKAANALLTWAGAVERAFGGPLPFGTSLVAEARLGAAPA